MATTTFGSLLWTGRLDIVEAPPNSAVACGDKIILPARVFEAVGDRAFNTSAPLLIRVAARKTGGPFCFGTVLEFASEANSTILPAWMLKHLGINAGGQVEVAVLGESLPKATFVSLQPQDPRFFDFKDFRAVLESAIGSHYATLMKGTTISINHFGEPYSVTVKDLAPEDACSIVDTEVEVDLVPPLDSDGNPVVIPAGSAAHEKIHGNVAESGSGRAQNIEISVTDETSSLITVPTCVPADIRPPLVTFVAPSDVVVRVIVETASAQTGLVGSHGSVALADVEVYLKEVSPDSESWPTKLDHDFSCNEGSYEGGAIIAIPARSVETKYLLAVMPSDECARLSTPSSTPSFSATVRVAAACSDAPSVEGEIRNDTDGANSDAYAVPDTVQCTNCKEDIPRARLALHSAYCERHNTRCNACGRVLRKALKESHWHCDRCADPPFAADTPFARAKYRVEPGCL